MALDWCSVELDDGWLVWLSAAPQAITLADPWAGAVEKLSLIQELGAIGVFERNLQTGEGRWDAQMSKLFGLAPDEPTPRYEAAVARIHPDDRANFELENARIIRDGGRRRQRYRVMLPDGAIREVNTLVEVRRVAQGTPSMMLGIAIDETELASRMRAQAGVSVMMARAIELAQISVWRIDVATNRIHFNDIGYQLSGLSKLPDGLDVDEMRSKAHVHPEDLPAIVQAAQAALTGTKIEDVEARYRNRDGTYRTLFTRRVAERDAQGRVTGLLGVSLDHTAQAAERTRAQALSRRIEMIAEAAELGVWSLDIERKRGEWNAQMFRIYGRPEDQEVPDMDEWLNTYVHVDDRPSQLLARERWMLEGGQLRESEFRIVRPDGTVRWLISRARRELLDGRQALVGMHMDVTERVMQRMVAEQALREKEAALRASQAKSEFLSRASHELRTPLNAVLGFAQLIEHDGVRAPAAVQLERVGHIRTAGEHLLALVDDVLDLAAIEAGSLPIALEPVAIDAVLREVVQWLDSRARHMQITVHLQPSGGWVLADARRLRQIIANLLTNAVKYHRSGGSVWVGAQPQGSASALRWEISVRDDGPGLSPEQQAHLFEAFQRLGAEREAIEGVGLGLTIAHQLAELMHGRIDVVSAVGEGSDFRVSLPAVDVALAAGPDRAAAVPPNADLVAPATSTGPVEASFSVVYIEDNPVNVLLVEGLVALRPGVVLHTAETGLSGVALALARRPDLVLIDMQLPDIDGLEVLRRLRAEASLATTVLVALSANGLVEEIARAKLAGFDDYWTKPIDVKKFLAGLDAIRRGSSGGQALAHPL